MGRARNIILQIKWKIMKLFPRAPKDWVKEMMWRKPWIFWPISYFRVIRIVRNFKGKGILIYPPTVDWAWMKQRPHQLVEGLSERGYLCLYVNINTNGRSGVAIRKINQNLYVLKNLHLLANIKNPLILISWTEHYKIIKRFQNPTIIYDYLDDLTVSAEEVDKEKIKEHEYFLKNSKIVMATADALVDDAKKFAKNIIQIPNAANYEDFHLKKAPVAPRDLQPILKKKRPIIGFYGALFKWFDYDLLKKLANNNPEWEFVLVGPDYDRSLHGHDLDTFKNIHWLGIKKHEELSVYLYYFDVAIIPFIVDRVTSATSPVKIFEYMAGGKPIVATDLRECHKYKCIFIGENHADFESQIKKAIIEGKKAGYQRLEDKEAKENTWENRLDVLSKKLEEILE